MNLKTFEYLHNELLPRISNYSKPNQSQKTILFLVEKQKKEGLTADEEKILDLEVKAEHAAEILFQKRQKANRLKNDIEKKQKEEERKLLTREKIIVGGLLLKYAENDSQMRQILLKLFNGMNDTDKNKEVLKRKLEAMKIIITTTTASYDVNTNDVIDFDFDNYVVDTDISVVGCVTSDDTNY